MGPAYPWWSFSGDNLARRKARLQVLKVTSGCRFTSGSILTSGCKFTSGSLRLSVSECKSQTAQMFRNVSYFSEVFCAELI